MADSPSYSGFVGIDIAAKTFMTTRTPTDQPRPRTFDHFGAGYQDFIAHAQTAVVDLSAVLVAMAKRDKQLDIHKGISYDQSAIAGVHLSMLSRIRGVTATT